MKNSGSSAIYAIGIIGALVYYLESASSILEGIIGIVKSIFWPGLIVYKILELLNL